MSEQPQDEGQQERYGSRFAQMFGFVTPEDRSKWEQARAQQKPSVNLAKKGMKAGADSMMDFGQQNMRGTLDAAHRVAAQQRFDEEHDKITSRHRDPRTRSIVESVDYVHKDDRETIGTETEPDFEM